jgi:hypothetical protein
MHTSAISSGSGSAASCAPAAMKKLDTSQFRFQTCMKAMTFIFETKS